MSRVLLPLSLLCGQVFAAAPGVDEECMREALETTEINLNSGVYNEDVVVSVPLTLKLLQRMDEQAYADCLARRGGVIQARDDACLRAVESCRDARAGTSEVRIERGATRLTGTDSQAWLECLQGELGHVEVQVLPPEPEREPE